MRERERGMSEKGGGRERKGGKRGVRGGGVEVEEEKNARGNGSLQGAKRENIAGTAVRYSRTLASN